MGLPISSTSARLLGLATLTCAAVAALVQARAAAAAAQLPPARRALRRQGGSTSTPTAIESASCESRELHGSAALLAASVLADSALEHYRGNFENPGMGTPLITAALTLLAGTGGAMSRSGRSGLARDGAYLTAAAVGAAGFGFHVYNIRKRVGRFNWLNLFYAAPLGAPAALSLAGLIGLAAQRVAATPSGQAPRLLGLPAGRVLSALTSVGLAGTASEAGLLHFRGAFQNPFMWLPVSVPPVASLLIAGAALGPACARRRRFTRWWLELTALLGIGGVGFHIYGVARQMGGWRNWSQNVLSGPPLPAPPSFSALALAGLSALSLIERSGKQRKPVP